MLFSHLRYSKILQVGIHVATSLMAVCGVVLGTLGVSLGRFFLRKETESSSSTISGSSLGYSGVWPAIQVFWYVHSW